MKITFLLPNVHLRGGTRNVIVYSDLLSKLGAQVTVVFPTRLRRLPLHLNELEWVVRAPYLMLFRRWFSTRTRLLPVPTLDSRYIPRADVVVATAWQTAEYASQYPADRGERYYLVQDIETYGKDATEAGATYRLPLRKIACSPWVRNRLVEVFGQQPWALIPSGVDLRLYRPTSQASRGERVTIGMLLSDERRKGSDAALDAFRRCHDEGLRFDLVCFSVTGRHPLVPSGTRICRRVPPADTPRIYAQAHVWVCSSRGDGMALPPLEAMASGCAIVTTRIGGTSYYAIPDRTALVCEPGDATGLHQALSRLITDRELRTRLAEAGSARIKMLDIASTAERLQKAMSGERIFVEPDTGLEETHCT